MQRQILKINCPQEWEGYDDFSSHLPMLWLAINKVHDGAVVEFGSGDGSTGMLSSTGDRFFSFETNAEWAEKYDNTRIVTDYKQVSVSPIGILFIDSAPGEQRKDLIELHKDNADVIIVHDTEEGAQNIYGIREILNSFKYRLNYYPKGNPGTTALSNKINICEWI